MFYTLNYAHTWGLGCLWLLKLVFNSILQNHSVCVLLLDKLSRSAVPALLRVRTLVLRALKFAVKAVAVPIDS